MRRRVGVLQIVTKMYFRPGARLNDWTHRHVLWTNCSFLRAATIRLPVGELAPSTGAHGVGAVTVTVREQLEAERDGQESGLVATSGEEIVDDLAAVLSFALNAVFHRSGDLVQRLVPAEMQDAQTPSSRLFNETFDPHRYVPEEQIVDVRNFLTSLLALEREHYEAAMRAIRRIVRATQRAAEDQTTAYVDIVAALESLSAYHAAPTTGFGGLEDRKQRIINEALADADHALADRVREAVVEADRPGIRRRFIAFVLDSIEPSFFRHEAVAVQQPTRRADLERAVKAAYDIRSTSVHRLQEMAAETQALGRRVESMRDTRGDVVLTLEGLARLARHVVRDFVRSAPEGVDPDFDWRLHVPGMLHMQLAPQYWVWQADGFGHHSVGRYFTGFVEHLVDLPRDPSQPIADMERVLGRIEDLLPGTHDGPARSMMMAIYALWHARTSPSLHRPDAEKFLQRHGSVLQRPSLASYVVALLVRQHPSWSAEAWSALAGARREERRQRSHLDLPPGVDVALQLMAAEALLDNGQREAAATAAAAAAEEAPGNEQIMRWEAALLKGEATQVDLRALLCGVTPAAPESTAPSEESTTEVGRTVEADEQPDQTAAAGEQTDQARPTAEDASGPTEVDEPRT